MDKGFLAVRGSTTSCKAMICYCKTSFMKSWTKLSMKAGGGRCMLAQIQDLQPTESYCWKFLMASRLSSIVFFICFIEKDLQVTPASF